MTDRLKPYEWQQVIYRVRTIWGKNQQWEKAEEHYRKSPALRRIPYNALMAAVGQFEMNGGKWPPAIPELMKATGYLSEYREHHRPSPDMCAHDGAVSRLANVEICAKCLLEWEAGTRPVTVGEYPYSHAKEKWQ